MTDLVLGQNARPFHVSTILPAPPPSGQGMCVGFTFTVVRAAVSRKSQPLPIRPLGPLNGKTNDRYLCYREGHGVSIRALLRSSTPLAENAIVPRMTRQGDYCPDAALGGSKTNGGSPMKRDVILRILELLAVVGLLMGAFTVPVRAAETIKVTVPVPSTTFVPLYHARAAGYFAEEGLDVDIVIVPGTGSVQAVLTRDSHFALAPGTHQLIAYERGQRLIAAMSILTRNSVNIVMHKDVARERGVTEQTPLPEKIRALRGLKLSGFATGAFAHQVMVHYLLKAGLDPQKDVQIIGLGTAPSLLLALEKRQIDAFATGTPVPEAAAARGLGVMIVDNSAGDDPDFAEFMMDVLLMLPETAKQRPDLVRKVVRALLRANVWLLEHPAEAALPAMKPVLSRIDDAVILAGIQKVRLGIPRDGRVTERAVALTQEFLRRIGAIKSVIPYSQLVTNEFLPR
jgi:ABC-type nitrate/sulfonate/bicarbonate transport system substrate-binding protein